MIYARAAGLSATDLHYIRSGSLSKDDGYGNENATMQEDNWLKKQKNSRAERAAWISVHFCAILHKTTTSNHKILGFGDNRSYLSSFIIVHPYCTNEQDGIIAKYLL